MHAHLPQYTIRSEQLALSGVRNTSLAGARKHVRCRLRSATSKQLAGIHMIMIPQPFVSRFNRGVKRPLGKQRSPKFRNGIALSNPDILHRERHRSLYAHVAGTRVARRTESVSLSLCIYMYSKSGPDCRDRSSMSEEEHSSENVYYGAMAEFDIY